MKSLYEVKQKEIAKFRRNIAAELFTQLKQVRYTFAATIRVSKNLNALRHTNVGGYLRDTVQSLKNSYEKEVSRRLFVTVISRNDRGHTIERELRDGQSRAEALADIKRELKQIRKRRREYGQNGIHTLPNHFVTLCYKKKLADHKLPSDNSEYVGIEIECVTPANADLSKLWPFAKYVNVGSDGSINYGRNEEGTEIRVCVKRGEVRKVVPELLKALRDLGARVNKSCGLHVHLDQRNNPNVAETYQKLVRAQSLLYAIVPQSRRENSYCKRTRNYNFNDARHGDRYHAINAAAYGRYHTIEVRLFGGTLDGDKIVNWIETLYGIAEGDVVLRCPKSFDAAKRHWKISAENLNWLKSRQAKFAAVPLAPVAESEGEEAEHRPPENEPLRTRRGAVAVSSNEQNGSRIVFNRISENPTFGAGAYGVVAVDPAANVNVEALQSGEIGRIEGVAFAESRQIEEDINEVSAPPQYQAVVHPTTATELAGAVEALTSDHIRRAVEQLREANAVYFDEQINASLFNTVYSNVGEEREEPENV